MNPILLFPPALTNVRKNLKEWEILIGPKTRHVRGQKRSPVRRNVVSKWPSSRKLVKIITCLKFAWRMDLRKKFHTWGQARFKRNFHAVGMAIARPYGFEIDFVRNPISGSAARLFFIILEFIFTPIFEIKIHEKNSLTPKKFLQEKSENKSKMAAQRPWRQRRQYLTPTAWELKSNYSNLWILLLRLQKRIFETYYTKYYTRVSNCVWAFISNMSDRLYISLNIIPNFLSLGPTYLRQIKFFVH